MNEEIVFKYFPELDARQREQTAALGQLYAEWNARINVISRKDMDSLYLHHVLHSLALVRYIRDKGLIHTGNAAVPPDNSTPESPALDCSYPDSSSLDSSNPDSSSPDSSATPSSSPHPRAASAAHFLDAGCGGGFPGIPMAIAMPECRFTLCDSIAKKIRVVTEISNTLGLNNVRPVWSRTEDLGAEYRCDWVVSRAVTELRRFIPLVRHLYSKGILYLKGGDLSEEIAACVKECRIDPAKVSVTDISGYFSEEFFESKKIICIFPQKH